MKPALSRLLISPSIMSKKEYQTRNTDLRFQIFQPLQKSEIVNLCS